MKRFSQILSLFLLSLVGITTATAQVEKMYTQDQLLTDFSAVVSSGQKVLLYHPGGVSDDSPAGFMKLDLAYPTSLSAAELDSCLYTFIAAGEKSADDYDLYYLQNKATGKYIENFDELEAENLEPVCTWTADVTKAMKLVVLPFTEDSAYVNTRSFASSLKQDLTNEGFVFSRSTAYSTEVDSLYAGFNMYIGAIRHPFYSPYVDTNVWQMYSYKEVVGKDKIEVVLARTFPSGVGNYTVGTAPGLYLQEYVTAAQTAYDAAQTALADGSTVTDEEAETICNNLQTAYDNLLSKGFIQLSEGYYTVTDLRSHMLTTNVDGGQEYMYSSTSDYTFPEAGNITVSDAKYVWKITPGTLANTFVMQNVYSGSYFNGNRSSAKLTDGGKSYIVDQTKGTITIKCNGGNQAGAWTFADANNDILAGKNTTDATYFTNWNRLADDGTNFIFSAVSTSEIEALSAQITTAVATDSISAIISTIESAIEGAKSYSCSSTSETFDDGGAMITDPGTAFFSENKSSAEGTFEALIDGDFTTYFHSDWSSSFTPSESNFHYLGIDLGSAVTGLVAVKMAKRVNAQNYQVIDYPTKVTFYGSNDAVIGDDHTTVTSGTWTKLNSINVDWSANFTCTTKDSTYAGGIGFATANLGETGYRYIKMAVMGTDQNRGYFALSEANVYTATEDTENSRLAQVSEATLTNLNNVVAEGKKEVANGTATMETYNNLKAAYAQFLLELPDPSKLTSAITSAKAFAATITDDMLGDDMGYYPANAKEALGAAIAEAEAYDTTNKSAAEINAQIDALTQAIADFKGTLIMPEAQNYYTFRSMSTKLYANHNNDGGTDSYRAQMYSSGNALTGNLFFTNGNHTETLADDQSNAEDYAKAVTDTIDATTYTQYLWYVEQAKGNTFVMRNVNTGMYLKAADGALTQSVEPCAMSVVLVKPGVFAVEAGEVDGVMQYLNASWSGTVGVWNKYSEDANSWWTFELVENNLEEAITGYWKVTPNVYQVLTLPFTVKSCRAQDGTAYSVVGINDAKQLVLAKISGSIPAGTPFIYKANAITDKLSCARFSYTFYGEQGVETEDGNLYNFATLNYNLDNPQGNNGLVGTLQSVELADSIYAYLDAAGTPTLTEAEGTTIAENSGFFIVNIPATEETGAATIDFSAVADKITSITNANVVVLPETVNVYSISGALLRSNVKAANAAKGLPAGIYVIGGQKVLVK